jgi:CHAT domain-containing protein
LPDGAALVDYVEFWFNRPSDDGPLVWRRALVAFVIRRDGDVEMFDLGEAAPVHAAIDAWRTTYGASADAKRAGELLRKRLWSPIEESLRGASLVLVSPDGELGKLPFAALPGSTPDKYLIEDVALAVVPVPLLIPSFTNQGSSPALMHELLVLGDVDFDRRGEASLARPAPADAWSLARSLRATRAATANQHWVALPGTRVEADGIVELYRTAGGVEDDAVMSLRGAAATEEGFRVEAPKSRIVHLATHGFFAAADERATTSRGESLDGGIDDEAPTTDRHRRASGLQSGLVLAGANAPPSLPDDPAEFAHLPEDGLLTAEELAALPLGGVELVVMSACETGLGKAAGGEGLLGIQRAFQIAGAQTTIASLWKVDDQVTQRLMTAFYRNVLKGEQSYLDALRNAQLEILAELRENGGAVDELRGANAPADSAAATYGAAYFWAAFTLSGDWR